MLKSFAVSKIRSLICVPAPLARLALVLEDSHSHHFHHHRFQSTQPHAHYCPSFQQQRQSQPSASYNHVRNYASSVSEESLFQRIKQKLGFGKTEYKPYVLHAAGIFLFVKVVDEVNYTKFFEICNMEDTFASWFAVMELHIWLLSCRMMQEGEDGRIVRNHVIKAMWQDVDIRSQKLDGVLNAARKEQMTELGDQFNTQMVSYDEGLLSSDRVLAGALWRRFLQQRPPRSQEELLTQMTALELLVAYTRSQFAHLHSISKRDLIFNQKLEWSPFDRSLIAPIQPIR